MDELLWKIAGLYGKRFNNDVILLNAGSKWSLEIPVLRNRMMNAWIGNGHEEAKGSIRCPRAMPC